jgi:3-oxoacyl-[acyl-carrier protein] reductase
MDSNSRVVLVTGAARGLGKAIAKKFLEEGETVIVTDIAEQTLFETVKELGALGSIEGIIMDVSDFDEVQNTVSGLIKKYKRIDVLVNNAGITADAQLTKMTEKQFDSVIAVNLKGVFCCTKAVVNNMIKNGYGKIINISSVITHNGNFGQTNYAASKAAVISMTQTWAKELGKKGINVNAIAPGYTLTEMIEKVPENILDNIKGKTPLKRFGQPEEIAAVWTYLSSLEAAFIHGSVLKIDGGLVL